MASREFEGKSSQTSRVRTLVDKFNVKITLSTEQGRLSLLRAIRDEQCDVFEDLVEKGAWLNIQDVCYEFSFKSSRPEIQTKVTEILLKNADVNDVKKCGKEPLFIAIDTGCRGAVYALLKAGTDVEVLFGKPGEQETALDRALHIYHELLCPKFRICGFVMGRNRRRYDKRIREFQARITSLEYMISCLINAGCNFNHDFLLRFSGKCRLACLYDCLKYLKSSPRSLQELCTFKIRKALGGRLLQSVEQLPLPAKLQAIVRLDHVLPSEQEVVTFDLLNVGKT